MEYIPKAGAAIIMFHMFHVFHSTNDYKVIQVAF